jgi:hypothetical protein
MSYRNISLRCLVKRPGTAAESIVQVDSHCQSRMKGHQCLLRQQVETNDSAVVLTYSNAVDKWMISTGVPNEESLVHNHIFLGEVHFDTLRRHAALLNTFVHPV